MFDNLNPIASDELTEQRRVICKTCPSYLEIEPVDVCGECNCPIKLKTALKFAHCPLEKW